MLTIMDLKSNSFAAPAAAAAAEEEEERRTRRVLDSSNTLALFHSFQLICSMISIPKTSLVEINQTGKHHW